MAIPGLVCQFSTDAPSALPTAGSWHDITPFVQSFHVRRGKQRILDRFEAGTMDMVLKNTDRRFDPNNTSSPYYPHLYPLLPIRLGFVVANVTTWIYTGFVERWPQIWKGPTWAEVDITCVDSFEFLSTHNLASVYATFTTAFGGNKDLTYTAVQIGFVGNSTTIAYVVAGINTALSVVTVGTAITVNVATGPGGAATSTASQVLTAVNGDVSASGLVSVALAPGSSGAGIVPAMGATNLAGGTFIQQLSGARVNAVLDYIGWYSTARTIATGTHQCQAQAIPISNTGPALDHLQSVELTEQGALFANKNGVIVFLDQTTLLGPPYSVSQATYTDAPSRQPGTFDYQDLQGDWDKDLIYNDVRSTRLNGIVQIADDTTSDMQFFTRSLDISPLSINDTESLALAQAYLTQYKQPAFRFEPMKLFPGSSTTFWQNLVARELMDNVTVARSPRGGGPQILKVGRVIAIEVIGTASIQNTVFTLQVDPISGSGAGGLVLNDATLGTLDSNSLGY